MSPRILEVCVPNQMAHTLTNLYNDRPQWLTDAHRVLDTAVAATYGRPADPATMMLLRELLGLNEATWATRLNSPPSLKSHGQQGVPDLDHHAV